MKGVVVTTQNEMYIKDFAQPLYETIGKEVGGWIEVVHPVGLKRAPSNLCFVCNEEGLLHNLPLNLFGSVLYGFHIHGNPIVGNIVFMREGMVDGEPDFVDLTDADIEWIKKLAHEVSGGEIREVEAGEPDA